MRILRLAKRVPPCPGGQERHILELTLEQAAAGHEVTLLHGYGELSGGLGWSARRVPLPQRPLPSTLGSLAFARAVRAALHSEPLEFDLVHAHGDYPEAFLAAAVARRRGCPAVVTTHASFGTAGRWQQGLRRRAYNRLDHVFCVSGHAAEQLRACGVTTPITVQHSGTRSGPLRALPRREAEPPEVVCVGRLVPMKRVDDLLQAARELREQGLTPPFEILGEGEEGERLRAAAADLPNVRFRGEVSRDEVYQALRRAAIYVLCSVDLPEVTEGTPTAAVEAVAAGLPVVATRAGGVAELLQDGVGGLLVPQRDPAALAAALARLLRDPELRRRCAAANEARAASLDWQAVAQVFTDVCERLVAERMP